VFSDQGSAGSRAAASPPDVAPALLAWYDANARDLPWRAKAGEKPDPYAVWLSEVMLQQTTVTAVKAYYGKFLALWPRVEDLAAAPLDEVMKAWAGLGYYSRARNLHACAKTVSATCGGRFPRSEDDLRALPGIGRYTAAAIAAIAFGARAVVVDGNVERVAARMMALETPLPDAKAAIRAFVDAITPRARCGDFAQALMDLGSGLCAPRRTDCAPCPLAELCAARRAGEPLAYARRAARAARPLRHGAAFYVRRDDGRILVRSRPEKGLLGAMTELPGSPWRAEWPDQQPAAFAPLPGRCRRARADVEHVFTHFSLRLEIFACVAPKRARPPAGCRWTPENTLADEALPSLMRKAIEAGARALADADAQELIAPKMSAIPTGYPDEEAGPV
jgi:A/G-specific adenine glycosylase